MRQQNNLQPQPQPPTAKHNRPRNQPATAKMAQANKRQAQHKPTSTPRALYTSYNTSWDVHLSQRRPEAAAALYPALPRISTVPGGGSGGVSTS